MHSSCSVRNTSIHATSSSPMLSCMWTIPLRANRGMNVLRYMSTGSVLQSSIMRAKKNNKIFVAPFKSRTLLFCLCLWIEKTCDFLHPSVLLRRKLTPFLSLQVSTVSWGLVQFLLQWLPTPRLTFGVTLFSATGRTSTGTKLIIRARGNATYESEELRWI